MLEEVVNEKHYAEQDRSGCEKTTLDGARKMESYQHRPRDPSPDWYNQNQTRGRNLGQSYRVNFSAQDGFSPHDNFHQSQYPERQPRRSSSADSRPQYNRVSTSNNGFDSSSTNNTSYREGNGFASMSSHKNGDSNRAHSDVGLDGGVDSLRFYQIPKYEAVVHDDSMLYSSSERRRYTGDSQEDFLVLGNKYPARSPATPGQASYNNRDDRIDFVDRRHPNATRNATQHSLYEQEKQYYNFAKENLITFGSCDAPTASTGLSQEELLQRKQREEATNKRKEKRRTKTKNRIINFPSNLRKPNSPQRSHYSQQNQQQNESLSSTYHKMSTLASLESNSRGENVYNDNDNASNPNGYASQGRGLRGSMVSQVLHILKWSFALYREVRNFLLSNLFVVNGIDVCIDCQVRRHKGKFKKSNNFTSQMWTEGEENSGNTSYMENNRGMKNSKVIHEDSIKPGNRQGNAKHAMYSTDRDYLLVQRDLDHSTPRAESTPRSRGSNTIPSYAAFTPKSEYKPRDLFPSKHQPFTKDSSPTSVMDPFGNLGGVRWNKNLTQQEIIVTPQSTKLHFDSQLSNSSGKPKSILRSRYSSSYATKVQSEGSAISYPFDENTQRQLEGFGAHGFDKNAVNVVEPPGYGPDIMRAFIDDQGRDLSPIGIDRLGDTTTKFPESYVQFIEAVAAVVIQTKIRQRLAKNKVQKLRNQRNAKRNKSSYRNSETKMSPMVRRSYALARKIRQANELKASKGRKDVALDFYALAAIQIQAAFRGWWVRDCLGVDKYCATMIQKTYRESRCRNEYLVDLNRIVTVQSICRRWMAIDVAVTRIYCIVRIQAIMRGSLVRKRMMFDSLRTYHAAATTIQTLWRSFVYEMTFLRAYEDILVVQSIVRGWIARRHFHSLLQAKNNKNSQRRKPSTRFKTSKLMSSKSRSAGTYSNHIEYMKKNLSPKSIRAELSVGKAKTPTSGNRVSQSPWKTQNKISNSNRGIQTPEKSSSNPGSSFLKKSYDNFESNKLQMQPVKGDVGKTVSGSRTDIERRRKNKEQELKAQKEEEKKRFESQASGMAELELARKKMAWKATERKEEKLRKEQEQQIKADTTTDASNKSHGHGDKMKTSSESKWNDSDYFAEVRKSFKKSNQVAAHSPQKENITTAHVSNIKSNKVDVKKSEVAKISDVGIPAVSSGKEESLVSKRREALMTSNGDSPSTTKISFSGAKCGNKSGGEVVLKKEASSTDIPQSGIVNTRKVTNSDIPKRTLVTKSAYQKEMQNLRSDSEQTRIDFIHHVFEQAGLFSRTK